MAQPEVRVVCARVIARHPHVGSTGFHSLYGHVKTDNLGTDSQVSVVYTSRLAKQAWQEWREEAAVRLYQNEGKPDCWVFTSPRVELYSPRGTVEFQFAIKYEVDGRSYWDNNRNKNYFLAAGEAPHFPPIILPYGRVVLIEARAARADDLGISFAGSIAVRSAFGNKEVKLVFTTDNWGSVLETYASYATALHYGTEVEIWKFSTFVPDNTKELRWAIVYTTQSGMSWDNNFGKDYLLRLPGRID